MFGSGIRSDIQKLIDQSLIGVYSQLKKSEQKNLELQRRIANLQSQGYETCIGFLFLPKNVWKINANNFLGVLTTYFKDGKLSADIRFQAHQNQVQILTKFCLHFGKEKQITFIRSENTNQQQKYSAEIDTEKGKFTGTFTYVGVSYPFSGELIK